MPSDWIVGPEPRLLSSAQIIKVEALTTARLGLNLPPFAELNRETWFPIFRQLYSDVEKHGKPGRGDTFNGIYGLNRGLCAAAIALALSIFIKDQVQWCISLGLIGVSLIYLYRMHRFGVHYAREIYNQFLLLPPEPKKTGQAKASSSK